MPAARLTAGVLTFLLLTAGVAAAASVDEAPPANEAVTATGSLGASRLSTDPLDGAATTTTAPAPTTPSTSVGTAPHRFPAPGPSARQPAASSGAHAKTFGIALIQEEFTHLVEVVDESGRPPGC